MDKQTGPKGFLVVLPSEIIEIPQDSDKSWLTLFYSLPRELAEKWKPAYELPRCPYEVLWTDKYNHIVCDDKVIFHLIITLEYYANKNQPKRLSSCFFADRKSVGFLIILFTAYHLRQSFKMLCMTSNLIHHR